MTTETISLATLARDAREHLVKIPDGPNAGGLTLTDNRPEWIHDLVFKAHGDFLPETIRYAMIGDALATIASADDDTDLDDMAAEFADEVTPYNRERLEWLGSHLDRAWYVDQVVDDLGHSEQGIMGDIAMGIYGERLEVFNLVREALTERANDIDNT